MPTFRDFVPEQRFQPTLAISPDGRRVAYSANTSGQYNLWVAALDGGEPARPLTAYTDEAVRHVAWSPDGESLAFSADRAGDEQFQIYVIPAAGGEARRLTDVLDRQHVLADSPFSPDGRVAGAVRRQRSGSDGAGRPRARSGVGRRPPDRVAARGVALQFIGVA